MELLLVQVLSRVAHSPGPVVNLQSEPERVFFPAEATSQPCTIYNFTNCYLTTLLPSNKVFVYLLPIF